MRVALRIIDGPLKGRDYVFDRHATFIVGRSPQADFSLPGDPFLSRNHFLIEFNPPICLLKDMGSTNGVLVNDQLVEEVRLQSGDIISAGQSAFQVIVEDSRQKLPPIHCLVCQAVAPRDVAVAVRPDEGPPTWICPRCASHRRRFPVPPDGYWIESRIGGGGMGEVFKARNLRTRQVVALKMMIPSAVAGDRAKNYFLREMEVLKDLRHPHIVAFYDMVVDLGQFHLIMEYVDGPNARKWMLKQAGKPSIGAVARIGVQLLSALEHAHGKGYVHRDIKPSNLLVTGTFERPDIKLSDFGLAKSFRDDAGLTGLTHQGDIGGSVGFISPDHIRDFREVKEPADIYSTGATLYYLLTGCYPFLDFDPGQTNAYAMILEHPSIPLRVHRPDAPDALDRVLRKSLEKQPRDRWKSAAAMAQALRPFLDEEP